MKQGRNYTPPKGGALRPAEGFRRKADDFPQRPGCHQSSRGRYTSCAGCRQLPFLELPSENALRCKPFPADKLRIYSENFSFIYERSLYNEGNDKSKFVTWIIYFCNENALTKGLQLIVAKLQGLCGGLQPLKMLGFRKNIGGANMTFGEKLQF